MSKTSLWQSLLNPWIAVHDGRSRLDPWLWANLRKALKQQKLDTVMQRLVHIVPDISNQYSNPEGMNCMDPQSPDYVPFYAYKVRAQHAFQVQFTLAVMQQWLQQHPTSPQGITLVDVGDSSGNHLRYLEHWLAEIKVTVARSLSVNLDPLAIEKVQQSGREALLCRAEHLNQHQIEADFMLTYEMLEHLLNPVEFLYKIAQNPPKGLLIATVPFLRKSRLGMHHIRLNITEYPADPEDVHIFELSPDDWKLAAVFAGWEVVAEQIYYQYPTRSIGKYLYRKIWQTYEYEGFYGFALRPNPTWAARYLGWPSEV